MTRLFILLYLGVLAVLFAAWYIHGVVWKQRARTDRARVFEEAHGGGARLAARELDDAPSNERSRVLKRLQERFDYPVNVVPLDRLPRSVRRRIAGGDDVIYFVPDGEREVVVAALAGGAEVVRLGPFPEYDLREIEQSIGGWMRLAADKVDAAETEKRPAVLKELQQRFDFPINVAPSNDLPNWPRRRLAAGADVVFYSEKPQTDDQWLAATPLATGSEVILCGPFPSFERIEQKAATTTLGLVLLPAALAIALLLRPVARQLRLVENAAKTIAAGDLGARVDERRVRSAKPLAQAFNNMAGRTETLVRTQRELLQAVSHELRTPLSRMKFAIELIETAKNEAERKQRLDSLDAATEELDELVGELIRYVRLENAQQQLQREPLAVADFLEVLVPKYAALHPAIEYRIREQSVSQHHLQVENVVFADRLGFERVLGNLLCNAGRFAKSRVEISSATSDGATTIDVDDDGAGIPQAERDRVFEPFVRLDENANTNGKGNANGRGVGLGLALVKRIVTQHGGSVEVLTSPMGGCRVRSVWPAEVHSDTNRYENATDGENAIT